MRLYATAQTRSEYLETQIQRSEEKFKYCKVSIYDVCKYADILARQRRRNAETDNPGPILCLGTRNGREIDLFRVEFFGPRWLRRVVRRLERRTHSFTSWIPGLEALARSKVSAIAERSVIGVELNLRAARADTWIGSFDELPDAWTERFGVVYSNSFDQSEDPQRTAREWCRVVRPGGYLTFAFTEGASPTCSDRVGGLCLTDVMTLFPGKLIYFQDHGSCIGYSEVLIQL